MLNQGNKILIVLLLIFMSSCENGTKENAFLIKVKKLSVQKNYFELYNNINDSVSIWSLNQLGLYTFKKGEFSFNIDSILCFNNRSDRLITCIHSLTDRKDGNSDGLIYLYGEKINNQWYFFRGASIVIARTMISGHHINKPLSYQQLHQIALKEVYSGYLNNNGEINEDWFNEHFENIGFGDFNNQTSSLTFLGIKEKFTDKRKFFEAIHLQSVKNNWYGVNKDSIKPLPAKNLP